MQAEELTSAVRRLIQGEEGIIPALRLVEAADIDDELAEQLRSLIEKRRIRFLVQASADGAEVDKTGLSYTDVLESLLDFVGELDDPDEKRFAIGIAAMLGSDKAAGKIKEGGGVARRVGQVITAPQGEDMGIAAKTNGKQIEPVWLMDGEFIISVPAVEGFGLRVGATREDAHAVGLEELNRLHEEHRNISLKQTLPEA